MSKDDRRDYWVTREQDIHIVALTPEAEEKAMAALANNAARKGDAKTRALVAQAVKILGDDPRTRRQIRQEMRSVARLKDWAESGQYGTLTKRHKEAARKLEVAVRQLQAAINNSDLPEFLSPPLDRFDRPLFDNASLETLRIQAEAESKKELRRDATNHARDRAVAAARRLLRARGLSVAKTRGGALCRLAAILYGTPRADFFHHVTKEDRSRA